MLKPSSEEPMECPPSPDQAMHKTAQTAPDVLSSGLEVTTVNFLYSGIYITWTKQLKDFCDFVGI